MTSNKVKRDVAMTGEITLRGRVLPIGGLKEKIYAAVRAGIKTVLIPDDNRNEIKEFDKELLKNIKIIPIVEASTIGIILMFLSSSLSNSLISFLLSSGIKTVLIPALTAA